MRVWGFGRRKRPWHQVVRLVPNIFLTNKESLAMSQTNSTHSESEVKPYKGTGIRMETKLMKQYREASPVNHGIQGAAVRNKVGQTVRNKVGQIEMFTVGTD